MLSGKKNPLPNYDEKFVIAAAKGDLATVKALFEDKSKHINPNFNYSNGEVSFPALYIAAQNGHLEVVKYLLAIENIDIYQSLSSDDTSPTHVAASKGHIEIVKAIVMTAKKNNINIINIQRSSDGATPLFFAAQNGPIEMVKLLLDAKADPNITNKKGFTPLDRAVSNDHLPICSLLDGFEQNMHSCLIQRMKALGFESNADGICYGFAQVAKLFALSGKDALNQLENTLFLLKRLKVKDLLLIQESHENLFKQAQQQALEELHLQNKILDEKETIQLRKTASQKLALIRKHLPKERQEEERNYLKILALFNGIELEFQGDEYPHLLAKHDLILISDDKSFTESEPQMGQLLLKLDKHNSLTYKLMLSNENIRENQITEEELKSKLQGQYQAFIDAFNTKNQPKLNTFLPHLLNITSKKGDNISERRAADQQQNPKWVTPLIQPDPLAKKGGEAELAHFTGAYKKEELPIYFKRLRRRLRQHKIKERVVLTLCCSNHAISVMYDPVEDIWRIFNINQLPSKVSELPEHIYIDEEDISEKIAGGFFSKDGNTIFETRLFTTKEAESLIAPAIKEWEMDLMPLHKITLEKISLFDYRNASWLWVAASVGDNETVKNLLSMHADINASDEDGINPLYMAAQRGHIKTVTTLLNHPEIKPNKQNNKGYFPLYMAAKDGHTEIVRKFLDAKLQEKIKPNLIVNDGSSPLIIASQEGFTDIVELLLPFENMAELKPAKNRATPLLCAAKNDHLDIIKLLLKEKSQEIDPNQQNEWGESALHYAANNGNIEMLNALLTTKFTTKIDINLQTKAGVTPLYFAAQEGYAEIVQALLSAGADPTISFKNYTPVFAATEHGHANVIKVLIEAKADLNIPDHNGVTPLIKAVENGYADIVKLLVDTGKVEINKARTVDGDTALHIAIKNGRLDIVNMLLQSNNINLNLRNKEGLTPLILAINNNQLEIAKALLQPRQVGSEIDINLTELAEPSFGWTALHYAVENDNANAIELLLEHKNINANAKTISGRTPLYLASMNGRLNAVKALLNSDKVDLHQDEKNGVSPLLIAADGGYSEIVQLLLAAKLDPNWTLSDGASPLYTAAHQGHFEAVKTLLEAGANPNLNLLHDNDEEYPPSILEAAVKKGHLDIIKLLLSYGAKPFVDAEKAKLESMAAELTQEFGLYSRKRKFRDLVDDSESISSPISTFKYR